MLIYINHTDIQDLLPREKSGKQATLESEIVDSILMFQGSEIFARACSFGYLRKGVSINQQRLTENQKLLLSLLNLELPLAEFTMSKAPEIEENIQVVTVTQRSAALKNISRFENRLFDYSFSEELPSESLCREGESTCFVYQFQRKKPDINSTPTSITINKIELRYSALVYPLMRLAGYPVTDLTDEQREPFARIVAKFTSACVLRIRFLLDNVEIEDQANQQLKHAEEGIDAILEHRYDELFEA
jgi:hypothetical protein